jgi:O-antigen/teichoic acid export membrane protein
LKSTTKQIGKDSLIYGLSGVLARSIHLITLPLFTRLFTPGEYAFIDMVTVVNGFLAAAISFGLDLAQNVYFFEEKKKGQHAQKKLVTAIFQLRLILGTAVVIICTLCFPIFNSLFFDDRLPWYYLAITFTGSLFIQISAQSAELFRLLFKPWIASSISLVQSFGSAVVAILMVLILDVGIFGVITGTLIGSISSAFFGWWMGRNYLDFSSLHTEWWSRLFHFGLPSIPQSFAGWFIMNLDRILIMNLLGPEAMGVYAVGIKIALIVALVLGSIKMAWFPIALDAIQTEKGKTLLRNASCAYLGLGFTFAIMISFLSPSVIKIISTPEYFEGHLIVGIMSLFFIFDNYLSISSLGLLKNKKTYLITAFAIVNALASLIVAYLLIPLMGILGAAVGMLFGIIIRNILNQSYSENFYHVNFENRVMFLQFSLTLITILDLLIYGSNIYSFLLSVLSIALILIYTFQNSEIFRHLFNMVWRKAN